MLLAPDIDFVEISLQMMSIYQSYLCTTESYLQYHRRSNSALIMRLISSFTEGQSLGKGELTTELRSLVIICIQYPQVLCMGAF